LSLAAAERVKGQLTMQLTSLRNISIATVVTLVAGFALVFFYAPLDADQGFIQKIFYVHVPLAVVALAGFVIAAVFSVRHLRTGDPKWDARSYVSIHLSIVFAAVVLITGSIWAQASWGRWWVWEEPTLVSFLIVFLLYATYYPLRYAVEDRERQARYASVFAIIAGAFVPLNFLAVRLADSLLHPRVFATAEGGMDPSMWLTLAVTFVGIALLWVTLVRFEIAAKSAAAQLARLRQLLDPAQTEYPRSKSSIPVTLTAAQAPDADGAPPSQGAGASPTDHGR
jgi:heme exporter protein C